MSYPESLHPEQSNFLRSVDTVEQVFKYKSEFAYAVWHLQGFLYKKVIDSHYSVDPPRESHISAGEVSTLRTICTNFDSIIASSYEFTDDNPIDNFDFISMLSLMSHCNVAIAGLGIYPDGVLEELKGVPEH